MIVGVCIYKKFLSQFFIRDSCSSEMQKIKFILFFFSILFYLRKWWLVDEFKISFNFCIYMLELILSLFVDSTDPKFNALIERYIYRIMSFFISLLKKKKKVSMTRWSTDYDFYLLYISCIIWWIFFTTIKFRAHFGCIKLTRNFLFIHQQFKIHSFAYMDWRTATLFLYLTIETDRGHVDVHEK